MAQLDEELDPLSFGVFAGSEAIDDLTQMKVKIDPGRNGLIKERRCEGCGRPHGLLFPWSELYAIQYAQFPQRIGQAMGRPDLFETEWKYSPRHRCLYPDFRCGCMDNPLVFFDITPMEAERQLRSAGRGGLISAEQQAIIRAMAPIVNQLVRGIPQPVPSGQVAYGPPGPPQGGWQR